MSKPARQTLYLHIGTHKTGSSSLQYWLGQNRITLGKAGLAFFTGRFEADNHVELFADPMRSEREAFSKDKYALNGTKDSLKRTEGLFAKFKKLNRESTLIASTEGLSLLRYDDEIERLKAILGSENLTVKIILVVRDKADFLESFRKQILKHPERELSADPSSINYVEPDSWLANYEEIKAVWSRHFGADAMTVIDYDAEMARDGDVLPAVLRAMEVPAAMLPAPGSVRVNVDSWKSALRRILRKLGLNF